MVKNGCGQSGYRTRKIGCILKMNSWNKHFLHAGTNLGKQKVDSIFLGLLR